MTTALAKVPVRRIVRAIADAAERWSDADFSPRVRLLDRIIERTGYSLPVVEYALDRIFFSLTARDIEAVLVQECGSLEAFDRMTPRPGRTDARALPAGSVCVISSRTTIGVAIVPAIFALCAKCDVLVKDREDGLIRAFFTSLADELDEMSEAAQSEAWDGERDNRDLSDFSVVVAFGNDATLKRIRERVEAGTFIGYGPKASIGYVARESLIDEPSLRAMADGAARDLLLYDTEGCLSLHALFVERSGAVDPEQFARILSASIERAAVEFPPGPREAQTSARIASARNLAAFRSAGGQGAVYSDERASYLAVLDPPSNEAPEFLPRSLAIRTVEGPRDVFDYLSRHGIPIEAAAVSGDRDDVTDMLVRSGANRITPFGELQRPPLTGNHGGRPRVAEFVRWVTHER